MLRSMFALFSVFALVAMQTARAAETDWNGVFKDPIFSPPSCNPNDSPSGVSAGDCSQLFVCASQMSSGDWYGQARMGNIAYLRGSINGNVWSGQYYFAGMESKMGTFIFTLSSDGNTYSINEFKDSTVQGSFGMLSTGTRMNSDVPDNKDCFQTDLDYLPTTHSWTGSYTNGATMYVMDDVDTAAFCRQSSYVYTYSSSNTIAYSSELGTCYENNQVSPGQYYESGSSQGLELVVAKNATSYYYLWWAITNVGDYNWTTTDPGTNNGYNPNVYYMLPEGDKLGYSSDKYICYEFDSVSMENSCLERSPMGTDISSSMTCPADDDNQDTYDGLAATLAVLLLNFVFTIGSVYYVTF